MDGDERLELMDSSADVFASSEKKKDKDEGRIKTAVRVRPFSDKEIAAGIKQCVTMEGRATTLKLEPVLREKTSRRQSVGADETTTAHTFKYDYSFYSFDREDPNFADQVCPISRATGEPFASSNHSKHVSILGNCRRTSSSVWARI
jgi:hypothetical protein